MTSLAVEGYERWEESTLVKLSEFLGFPTVGFEAQIIDLMRKLLVNQNQGLSLGQKLSFRCERELKKLECMINYNEQNSRKGANRDMGNPLLKL